MSKKILLLLILSILCGGVYAQKKKTNKKAKPVTKEEKIKFVPPKLLSDSEYSVIIYNENIEEYWKKILTGFEEAKKIDVPAKLIIPETTEMDLLWSDIFRQDSIKWDMHWKRYNLLSDANDNYHEWVERYTQYKENASENEKKKDKTTEIINKYLPLINKMSDKEFNDTDELAQYLSSYKPMISVASLPTPETYKPATSASEFASKYSEFAEKLIREQSDARNWLINYEKREIKLMISDYNKYKSQLNPEEKEQLNSLGLRLIEKLKEMPEANDVRDEEP